MVSSPKFEPLMTISMNYLKFNVYTYVKCYSDNYGQFGHPSLHPSLKIIFNRVITSRVMQ